LLPWISQTVLKQHSELPVLLPCPTRRGHKRAFSASKDAKDSGVERRTQKWLSGGVFVEADI
jgi:hypothetical protein